MRMFTAHVESSVFDPSVMVAIELHVEIPDELGRHKAGFREC